MSGPHPGVLDKVPAPALVLAGIVSVQWGGALAVTLLPMVGAAGSVTLRLVLATVVLLLIARPRLRGRTRTDWRTVSAFGVALAMMNLCFYGALTRLPIGVAVTIEFVGPLVLAATTSRRTKDLMAVGAAAVGVALISGALNTPWSQLDGWGIVSALLAGGCWAAYILLSARTGSRFAQLDGLAIAMLVACVVITPAGLWSAGSALFSVAALSKGAGIAVLSSVLPYSLELIALRRLSANVFGILLSLEPAAAAVAGLLVLKQRLDTVQLAGMVLVIAASAIVLGRRAQAGGRASDQSGAHSGAQPAIIDG